MEKLKFLKRLSEFKLFILHMFWHYFVRAWSNEKIYYGLFNCQFIFYYFFKNTNLDIYKHQRIYNFLKYVKKCGKAT